MIELFDVMKTIKKKVAFVCSNKIKIYKKKKTSTKFKLKSTCRTIFITSKKKSSFHKNIKILKINLK